MTVMAIPRTTIVPTEQNKHMTAIAFLHVGSPSYYMQNKTSTGLLRCNIPQYIYIQACANQENFTGEGETGGGFFDNFFKYFKEVLLDLRMYMIIIYYIYYIYILHVDCRHRRYALNLKKS